MGWLDDAWDDISGIGGAVGDALTDLWDSVDELSDKVASGLKSIDSFITNTIPTILAEAYISAKGLFNSLITQITALEDWVSDKVSSVVKTVNDGLEALWEAIDDIGSEILSAANEAIAILRTELTKGIKAAQTTADKAAKDVGGFTDKLADMVANRFMQIMDKLLDVRI